MTYQESRADQIFKRFARFHNANPNFWRLFRQFTDSMRQSRLRYSARAIFHRVRWEMDTMTENTDGDSLKLNDHYSPYYARMYLAIRPDAEGFFELRKRTSQERAAYETDITFSFIGHTIDEDDLMITLAVLADEVPPIRGCSKVPPIRVKEVY